MLDLYYRTERPLPESVEEIARLIRMRDHGASIRDVLSEFFVRCDGGWSHGRCEREIASFKAMVEGGRKGAAKRWAKAGDSHPIATPIATPSTPQCQPEPEPEPEYSVAKATGGKPPKQSPEEIIFCYGVPLLVSAGSTDKAARSFLGGLRKASGDAAVVNALRDCIRAKPLQPLEWLAAALPPASVGGKQTALERRNAAVVAQLGAMND